MYLNGRTFENGQILLEMLGTFWALWFNEKDTLKNCLDGQGQQYFESYLQWVDAFNCVSKETVPTYASRQWKLLVLSQSEQLTADQLKISYGTNLIWGETIKRFGDLADTQFFSYPLDVTFMDCSHIVNRLIDPSMILTRDIDFFIDPDKHIIGFVKDPMTDPLSPIRHVVDDTGAVVDTQIGFWAANVQVDQQMIWQQFGYVLNIWMQSSDFYQQFISALWDSLVQGPSKSAVKLSLSALTGVPFAKGNETVENILSDASRVSIVTDQNVYEFKPTATPVVTVGQALDPGDALITAVRIFEPAPNTDWASFVGLSLGQRFTGLSGMGPIFFSNQNVDLEYLGKDVEGRTIVRFDVNGWPDDVENFWRQVHANGIQGKTLAEYLDLRSNPVNQPDMRDLPSQVNPFLFVMNNLFRNNLYIVYLKIDDFADGAPGIRNIVHLYKYLPPHTTFIIFVELAGGSDEMETSMEDSVEFMPAVTPMEDAFFVAGDEYSNTGMLIDLGPRFKTVAENCK